MTAISDKFSNQLDSFGREQMAGLKSAEITRTTTHLILATAFFTGAILFLANHHGIPKPRCLKILITFLARTFGLAEQNASGLIASNARMYKRYTLIENIYKAGWKSAKARVQEQSSELSLKSLLTRYHDLGMSNLSIEGIKAETTVKESSPPTPVPAEEPVLETEPASCSLTTILIRVVIVMLLGAVVYVYYHPEKLPQTLQQQLQSIINSIS